MEFVDFVPYVSSVLHETGFEPSCLKLEITEGTMMATFGNTLDTLALCVELVSSFISTISDG